MIPGPLLLIGLPLIAAPVVYLTRRRALIASTLAAGTSLGLGLACLRLPLDAPSTFLGQSVQLGQPVFVLGRELALQPAGALALGFVFVLGAVVFFLACHIPQGRLFCPVGLILLSMISANVMIRHLLFAALALWLAGIVATFLIQENHHNSVRGALRYVTMHTLAVPPFLITSWLLDLYIEDPGNLAPLRTFAILLTLGFSILLAVAPFQGWVTAVAKDAPPLGTALLFSAENVAVLLLLASLLRRHPWLLDDPLLFQALTWGGLLMVGLGGLMAPVQQDFGHLLGYGIMVDMGGMLMALATASDLGVSVALALIGFRAVSLTMTGMGLSAIRQRTGSDAFADLGGTARQRPMATAALILGGLSLAGLPPLAGFAGRWALLDFFAPEHILWCWLIFLAGCGVAIGYLRGLRATLAPATGESEDGRTQPEPVIVAVMTSAMLVLSTALSFNPQPVLSLATRIVAALVLPLP
jgi:formate hydrogenlyase subunit 3/multisubunit Na+/H+ antiporter MnhD subunit